VTQQDRHCEHECKCGDYIGRVLVGIDWKYCTLICEHDTRLSLPPSSTDLLLIANDEWKRREERHHLHERIPWTVGWISGFLTSRKFVAERIKELHKEMEK
jgi:hypothetical protein